MRKAPSNEDVKSAAKRAVLARGAFGVGRLHGLPGERERLRLRNALAAVVRLRLGRLRLGGLLREDIFLGSALEQLQELILVDRLALDEDRRELVQLLQVLLEHLPRPDVRLLDDAADLAVDLAGYVLGVVRLVRHLAPQERHVLVPAEDAWAELLTHAVAHDHLLRGARDLLEVVRGTRGHFVEDELL